MVLRSRLLWGAWEPWEPKQCQDLGGFDGIPWDSTKFHAVWGSRRVEVWPYWQGLRDPCRGWAVHWCKVQESFKDSTVHHSATMCNTSVPSVGTNWWQIRFYMVLFCGSCFDCCIFWQAAYSIIRLKNDADKIWKVLQTSYIQSDLFHEDLQQESLWSYMIIMSLM